MVSFIGGGNEYQEKSDRLQDTDKLYHIKSNTGHEELILKWLSQGKWNKKLLSLPNFYFPVETCEPFKFIGGFGDMPHMQILKYLMQNPSFWAYLKGFWCLKRN